MTNEEKAREIRSKLGIYADAYYGAMEMAEWKDQQFKEFLTTLKFQSNLGILFGMIEDKINELSNEKD